MEYSLSGAAKATGSSKSLIHRMCEDGRLSHRKMSNGQYRIDASELGRAFSEKNPVTVLEPLSSTTEPPGKKGGTELATVHAELAVVQMKAQMLEDQLGRERETVDDLRRRLDQEQEERRNLQRQLAPPLQPAQEPTAVIDELRRRLEASEARNLALMTAASAAPPPPSDAAQDQPRQPSAGLTAAAPLRSFLGRLLGR